MPPKIQKSKAAKMLAASSSSKAKGKKKKWAKTRVREKKNHRVVFDQALWDKLLLDAPKKMKVISVYTLIEQYKINGSLARRAMTEMRTRGMVTTLDSSCRCPLYTRKGGDKEEEETTETTGKKGKK
jgi:small subunit ribosomal protein S25e